MSGTSVTTNSGGDVSIVVGGTKISGWLTVSVTRSAEHFPNSFELTAAEVFRGSTLLLKPGAPCQIFIGQDLVITGRIDRYSASFQPGSHEVQISGRGICQDLVDCSADLLSPDSPIKGGQISAANTLGLAQALAKSFGLSCRSAVADLGRPIQTFQIALGETPYEVISRVAQFASYLVYEDELGQLVLDRVGTLQMASGFAQGINVEAATSRLSVDQRFSSYTAVYNAVDQLSEGANSSLSNQVATVTDAAMVNDLKLHRPKIFVSPQTQNLQAFATQLVNWMMARNIGRSQSVEITCDSWRDSAGMLWQPNRLVSFDLPALNRSEKLWIIASVVFRKDGTGTHADLVLMPPDAFSVQPSTLNIFDAEITAGEDALGTQNPAPPTTGPRLNPQGGF